MGRLLKVDKLCKDKILKDISFEMEEGEMIAVMGPSGSGKSTLLYNVSGMDTADSGEVWLDDTEIVSLSEDEKAALRLSKMGFVFQQMNVIANLNIMDNILLPSVHFDKSKAFRIKQEKKAEELLEKFGIKDLKDRRVSEVSGGQLQRVCICRSLMLSPEILFADEPTGALNKSASEEVINTFLQINSEGTSVLMVTHDSKVAAKCQRILYILDGKLQGEMKLGKFEYGLVRDGLEEEEFSVREKKTNEWLMNMGW